MFSSLANDRIILVKQDGTEYPESAASVSAKLIVIPNGHLPVEEGDTIIRKRTGVENERYLVIDPGFHAGHGGIPAHYQVKFEKQSRFKRPSPQPVSAIYNLIGPNSRVNVSSTDASANVVNVNSAELFEGIRSAIQKEVTDPIRQDLLAAVEALAHAKPGSSFAKRYAEFIQLAANHIALIGPWLPALGQKLTETAL